MNPAQNPAKGGLLEDTVPPLGRGDFQEIRRLAHRAFGLDLKTGKEELVAARLRRLLREGGFHSYHDFCRHVVSDRTGEALARMIDALATNHTSFLREPDHFDFLRQQIIPALAARRQVEVWCAACSSGEEVWTLACTLNDALPTHEVHIYASDISNKALQFAARGVYPVERCHGLPPSWISRYFVLQPGARNAYAVCPQLRAQATFRRINLVEGFSWPRPFPLIFCRNVMIYFDQQTQEGVVNRMADALEPGGYLFVGHAESLNRFSHGLEYVKPAIYRKPKNREEKWTR